MVFKDALKLVDEAKTESDLSHNWLVRILDLADPRGSLKRRWEKRNQKGRCDLALRYADREVCIVETKKPEISNLEDHYVQAHRYAFAQNYWRDGKLVPVLGILTNGYKAIIFNGAAKNKDSFRTKIILDLHKASDFQKFRNIFKKLATGHLGHPLHHPVILDRRNMIVEELSKELLKYYKKFKKKYSDNAFEYMLQMFLVAVLRDCGYIPTELMQGYYDTGKWKDLSCLLNEMLNSAFNTLPNGRKTIIETVYQETTSLCARLDRVPPDCLGLVYETVLHKIHKQSATTSYYTPHELALDVIVRLDPKPSDLILDPSCGSGTFLTASIDYITSKYTDMREPRKLFAYVRNKIRGIDKDIYACHVAKAMVLASVASHLDFDLASRNLILPNLTETIINMDLFRYYPKKKANIIVGNLPWGHVDGKRKDEILDPVVRKFINFDEFESYYRNVDISSIVLEYVNELFLKNGGKLGLLVKQQSLYASDSKNFQTYAKRAGIRFWDFGPKELFSSAASLTAIAWRGTEQKSFIIKKYSIEKSLAENGKALSAFGLFFKGFESAADPVYKSWADRHRHFSLVKKVYPGLRSSKNLFLPRTVKIITFIKPGSPAPDYFVNELTTLEKEKLINRAQVAKTCPYSWRGAEGIDYYQFDGTQKRIVFPRNFTYGEHMYAMLDVTGEGLPITSHTVFIPNDNCTEENLFSILGWLNSKYLINELDRAKVKKLAHGGFGVYPKDMAKVKIPEDLLTKEFSKFIKKGMEEGTLTVEDIDNEIKRVLKIVRKAA